jgi:hypothetical protein
VTIVTPEPQPEPSITQLIRGLDNVASTLGPPATTDETPAVASVEPAPGPITSMIHALDGREAVSAQPVQTPTEVSPTMTLTVSDANGERRIDVDNSGATIGRAAENTIRIEDERVSRVHARIDMTGDGFFLVHLSATNATLVNDAPIDMPRKLHAGDTVILGGVQMRVEQIER